MKRILETLDVRGLLRAWPKAFPHINPPATYKEALITLHIARVKADVISEPMKAYSRQWLIDNNNPIVDAVGISVNSKYREVKTAIHNVMRDVVLDTRANGDTDQLLVRKLMQEARMKERKGLCLPRD